MDRMLVVVFDTVAKANQGKDALLQLDGAGTINVNSGQFHLESAATSQQQTSSDEGEDAHNQAGGHACQKSRVLNSLVRCIYKISVQ